MVLRNLKLDVHFRVDPLYFSLVSLLPNDYYEFFSRNDYIHGWAHIWVSGFSSQIFENQYYFSFNSCKYKYK